MPGRDDSRRALLTGGIVTVGLMVAAGPSWQGAIQDVLVAAGRMLAVVAAACLLWRRNSCAGRVAFALALAAHGAMHLLVPEVMHAWMAGWVPGAATWPYVVAVTLLTAATLIIAGDHARPAAVASCVGLAGWVLLVRWPGLVWNPEQPGEWVGLAAGAVMCGAAWMTAEGAGHRRAHARPRMHHGPRRAAFVILLLLPWHAARAQSDSVQSGHTWGFVTARYSTGTSGFLFGGYTEFLGGVGARFATGPSVSHAVAVAASRATESWYGQLYWLPALSIGRAGVEATGSDRATLRELRCAWPYQRER